MARGDATACHGQGLRAITVVIGMNARRGMARTQTKEEASANVFRGTGLTRMEEDTSVVARRVSGHTLTGGTVPRAGTDDIIRIREIRISSYLGSIVRGLLVCAMGPFKDRALTVH